MSSLKSCKFCFDWVWLKKVFFWLLITLQWHHFFQFFFTQSFIKVKRTYSLKIILLPFIFSEISEVEESWFCNSDSFAKRLWVVADACVLSLKAFPLCFVRFYLSYHEKDFSRWLSCVRFVYVWRTVLHHSIVALGVSLSSFLVFELLIIGRWVG